MSGQPDDREGGPPESLDLPDAIPQRIRERILTGRTERLNDGTDTMEGMI